MGRDWGWGIAKFISSYEGQVSKTADWLKNFYKDACAQRWPLTYCGDCKRSENKKVRNRAAIEWYFELLLIFACPVCQNRCSFINGNLRRKIGLLKNSTKLMDCNCLPTTTTMFGFCFGFGYTGRAVNKTRNVEHPGTFQNIPEHPGTSNNYDNYEKNV